jgi:hypothetical protein
VEYYRRTDRVNKTEEETQTTKCVGDWTRRMQRLVIQHSQCGSTYTPIMSNTNTTSYRTIYAYIAKTLNVRSGSAKLRISLNTAICTKSH